EEAETDAEAEEEIPVAVNCAHALKPPKGYDTGVLMLQIFLDRHNFSCGVIDGVWGRGSLEAMRAWQQSQGLRRTQWVNPV
ncbi:peptidoglycan-binding domain-containing protein, partial [Salmonella enterica]|uniref:peptidoglycan-binding domain-containing protein n=1 Tax=Salmonella enterica TaxID=28901 RepID=UPI0020C2CB3F